MPFDDAKSYRFNPFDLTKVWPHSDYPLVEVGRMTLDRNPTDHHSEIEQLAVEPSNLVPGIGPSPDKMLLGRMFSYPDAHRYRIGANYNQLPVNAPQSPVNSYSKDGAMRYDKVSDPVYAPNSKGGPSPDAGRYGEPAGWHTDGDLVRSAYTLHAEDDDWGQAGTLVRDVLGAAERDRLVSNIVGHLLDGVSEPVLQRAIDYWGNVDRELGRRVEHGVRGRRQVAMTRRNDPIAALRPGSRGTSRPQDSSRWRPMPRQRQVAVALPASRDAWIPAPLDVTWEVAWQTSGRASAMVIGDHRPLEETHWQRQRASMRPTPQ